jgi:hypothetical protein
MKDIKIEGVLNGWIVSVGCQKIVFTSRTQMFKEMGKYFDNPKDMERKYLKKAKNGISENSQYLPFMEYGLSGSITSSENQITFQND